jgi:hypothetical protein
LVELGLLRRVDRGPEAFLTTFFDTRPHAFAITAKGLRLLAAQGITIPVSPKRADVLIAHEVAVAEACFDVAGAVAARPSLYLIDTPELIIRFPQKTRSLRRPLRLQPVIQPGDFHIGRHLVRETTTVGVEPDRLIIIARQDPHGWFGICGALELDRGGEPLTAKRLSRASWTRKTIGYVAAWSQGLHIEQWGEMCRSFRVLVITPSLGRARNIIELQREIGAPPGLFNFTTPELLRERGALAPIWMTAKSDNVSLMDHD